MPQYDGKRIYRLTRLALLTAFALIIFVIELHIPNPAPVPGVKLGLANIITVYAVYNFRAGETFAVVIVRILLGSIFGGGVSALIFSLSGGLLCLCAMIPVSRIIDEDHIWLSSIVGAIFHELGQTAAAVVVMGTWAVVGYLPILMVSGCIAGTFTGICAQLVIKRMKR